VYFLLLNLDSFSLPLLGPAAAGVTLGCFPAPLLDPLAACVILGCLLLALRLSLLGGAENRLANVAVEVIVAIIGAADSIMRLA
jgi:hypothetical protein